MDLEVSAKPGKVAAKPASQGQLESSVSIAASAVAIGNNHGNHEYLQNRAEGIKLTAMHESTSLVPFGERLKSLLTQKGITQAHLAARSGLERSTISRLIRGQRSLSSDAVHWLCPVLEIDIDDLVRGTDAEPKIRELSKVVRREVYDSVVKQLADYEGKYNDLQRKLEFADESLRKERERARESTQDASAAHIDLAWAKQDLEIVKEQNKKLIDDVKTYRAGLQRAVDELGTLRQQLSILAIELKDSKQTSKATSILSGIAAFTGVVTVAHFLKTDEPSATDDSEQQGRSRRRHT